MELPPDERLRNDWYGSVITDLGPHYNPVRETFECTNDPTHPTEAEVERELVDTQVYKKPDMTCDVLNFHN